MTNRRSVLVACDRMCLPPKRIRGFQVRRAKNPAPTALDQIAIEEQNNVEQAHHQCQNAPEIARQQLLHNRQQIDQRQPLHLNRNDNQVDLCLRKEDGARQK